MLMLIHRRFQLSSAALNNQEKLTGGKQDTRFQFRVISVEEAEPCGCFYPSIPDKRIKDFSTRTEYSISSFFDAPGYIVQIWDIRQTIHPPQHLTGQP